MSTRRKLAEKGATRKRVSAPAIDKEKLRERLRIIGDEGCVPIAVEIRSGNPVNHYAAFLC